MIRLIRAVLIFAILIDQPVLASGPGQEQTFAHDTSVFEALCRIQLSRSEIESRWRSPEDGPVLVLIRDLHCQEDAQIAVSKTLKELSGAGKIRLIFVEGAAGRFDLDFFQVFPSDRARSRAAAESLKLGVVNAAEYAALKAGFSGPFRLHGVEDAGTYLENLRAFVHARTLYQRTAGTVERLEKAVQTVKEAVFTQLMMRILRLRESLQSGEKLDVAILVAQIKDLLTEAGRSPGKDLRTLIRTVEASAALDEAMIQADLTRLNSLFQSRLSPGNLRQWVKTTLEYRMNKITAVSYLNEARRMMRGMDLSFDSEFPSLFAWRQAERLRAEILRTRAWSKLDVFLEALMRDEARAAGVEKEARLVEEWGRVKRLIRLTLPRRDASWAAAFDSRGFSSSLEVLARRFRAWTGPPVGFDELAGAAGAFYRLARDRDGILVRKSLAELERSGERAAVLICGGFHSEGIEAILRGRGVSYITLMPKVRSLADGSLYERVMVNSSSDLARTPFSPSHLAAPALFGSLLEAASYRRYDSLRTGLLMKMLGDPEIRGIPVNGFLNQWVRSAAGRNVLETMPPADFSRLLRALSELYPREILTQLTRIDASNRVQARIALRVIEDGFAGLYPELVEMARIHLGGSDSDAPLVIREMALPLNPDSALARKLSAAAHSSVKTLARSIIEEFVGSTASQEASPEDKSAISDFLAVYAQALRLQKRIAKDVRANRGFNRKIKTLRPASSWGETWTGSVALLKRTFERFQGKKIQLEVVPESMMRKALAGSRKSTRYLDTDLGLIAYTQDQTVYVNEDATLADLWMFIAHEAAHAAGRSELDARRMDVRLIAFLKGLGITLRRHFKPESEQLKEFAHFLADLIELKACDYELDLHSARLRLTGAGRAFLAAYGAKTALPAPPDEAYLRGVAAAVSGVIRAEMNHDFVMELKGFDSARGGGKEHDGEALKQRLSFKVFRSILNKVIGNLRDIDAAVLAAQQAVGPVRDALARAAASLRDLEASKDEVKELARRIMSDKNPLYERVNDAVILDLKLTDDALEVYAADLVKSLLDHDRPTAIRIFRELRNKTSVWLLAGTLDGKDASWAHQVLQVFSYWLDHDSPHSMFDVPGLREKVLGTFTSFSQPGAEAISEASSGALSEAAYVAGTLRMREAPPLLIKVMKDRTEEKVLDAASLALSKIADRASVAMIAAELMQDEQKRTWALKALGRMSFTRSVVEVMNVLAEPEDIAEKIAAYDALESLLRRGSYSSRIFDEHLKIVLADLSNPAAYASMPGIRKRRGLEFILGRIASFYIRDRRSKALSARFPAALDAKLVRAAATSRRSTVAYAEGLSHDAKIGLSQVQRASRRDDAHGKILSRLLRDSVGPWGRAIKSVERLERGLARGDIHYSDSVWIRIGRSVERLEEQKRMDEPGMARYAAGERWFQRRVLKLAYQSQLDDWDLGTPKARGNILEELLGKSFFADTRADPEDYAWAYVEFEKDVIAFFEHFFLSRAGLAFGVSTAKHEALHYIRKEYHELIREVDEISLLGAASVDMVELNLMVKLLGGPPVEEMMAMLKAGSSLASIEAKITERVSGSIPEGLQNYKVKISEILQGMKLFLENDRPMEAFARIRKLPLRRIRGESWPQILRGLRKTWEEEDEMTTFRGRKIMRVDTYRQGPALSGYAWALAHELGRPGIFPLVLSLMAKDSAHPAAAEFVARTVDSWLEWAEREIEPALLKETAGAYDANQARKWVRKTLWAHARERAFEMAHDALGKAGGGGLWASKRDILEAVLRASAEMKEEASQAAVLAGLKERARDALESHEAVFWAARTQALGFIAQGASSRAQFERNLAQDEYRAGGLLRNTELEQAIREDAALNAYVGASEFVVIPAIVESESDFFLGHRDIQEGGYRQARVERVFGTQEVIHYLISSGNIEALKEYLWHESHEDFRTGADHETLIARQQQIFEQNYRNPRYLRSPRGTLIDPDNGGKIAKGVLGDALRAVRAGLLRQKAGFSTMDEALASYRTLYGGARTESILNMLISTLPDAPWWVEKYGFYSLVLMGTAAGSNAEPLFRYGLPALRSFFGEDIEAYHRDIVELSKSSGHRQWLLFANGFPAMQKLLAEAIRAREPDDPFDTSRDHDRVRRHLSSYWPVLWELAHEAGNKAWLLFEYGLPSLAHLINSPESLRTTGLRLVEMLRQSAEHAEIVFKYGIPSVAGLIRIEEDINDVVDALLDSARDAGPHASVLFEFGLTGQSDIVTSLATLRWVMSDLTEIIRASPAEAQWILRDGLAVLNDMILDANALRERGSELVLLTRAAGPATSRLLLSEGLAVARKVFGPQWPRYWDDVYRMGLSSGRDAWLLYEYGIPAARKFLGSGWLDSWLALRNIAARAGPNAWLVFDYGFRSLRDMIKDGDSLETIGEDLAELADATGQGSTGVFMFGLDAMRRRLGAGFKDRWLDVLYLGKNAGIEAEWLFDRFGVLARHLFGGDAKAALETLLSASTALVREDQRQRFWSILKQLSGWLEKRRRPSVWQQAFLDHIPGLLRDAAGAASNLDEVLTSLEWFARHGMAEPHEGFIAQGTKAVAELKRGIAAGTYETSRHPGLEDEYRDEALEYQIYLFDAIVRSARDFVLGFKDPRSRRIYLAREAVNEARRESPDVLRELIWHEARENPAEGMTHERLIAGQQLRFKQNYEGFGFKQARMDISGRRRKVLIEARTGKIAKGRLGKSLRRSINQVLKRQRGEDVFHNALEEYRALWGEPEPADLDLVRAFVLDYEKWVGRVGLRGLLELASALRKEGFSVAVRVLSESLPRMWKHFDRDLEFYWPGLVRLAAAAGPRAAHVLEDGVVALKRQFGPNLPEYWNALVKLGVQAGERSHELFESALPPVGEIILDEPSLVKTGQWLMQIQERLPEQSWTFFNSGLVYARKVWNGSAADAVEALKNLVSKTGPDAAFLTAQFAALMNWGAKNPGRENHIRKELDEIASLPTLARTRVMGVLLQEFIPATPEDWIYVFTERAADRVRFLQRDIQTLRERFGPRLLHLEFPPRLDEIPMVTVRDPEVALKTRLFLSRELADLFAYHGMDRLEIPPDKPLDLFRLVAQLGALRNRGIVWSPSDGYRNDIHYRIEAGASREHQALDRLVQARQALSQGNLVEAHNFLTQWPYGRLAGELGRFHNLVRSAVRRAFDAKKAQVLRLSGEGDPVKAAAIVPDIYDYFRDDASFLDTVRDLVPHLSRASAMQVTLDMEERSGAGSALKTVLGSLGYRSPEAFLKDCAVQGEFDRAVQILKSRVISAYQRHAGKIGSVIEDLGYSKSPRVFYKTMRLLKLDEAAVDLEIEERIRSAVNRVAGRKPEGVLDKAAKLMGFAGFGAMASKFDRFDGFHRLMADYIRAAFEERGVYRPFVLNYLGVSRSYLDKKVKAYGIDIAAFRHREEDRLRSLLNSEIAGATFRLQRVARTLGYPDAQTLKNAYKKDMHVSALVGRFLEALLEHTGGNMAEAARLAGLPESTLQNWLDGFESRREPAAGSVGRRLARALVQQEGDERFNVVLAVRKTGWKDFEKFSERHGADPRVREVLKRAFEEALSFSHGQRRLSSRLLGLNHTTFLKWAKILDISLEEFRPGFSGGDGTGPSDLLRDALARLGPGREERLDLATESLGFGLGDASRSLRAFMTQHGDDAGVRALIRNLLEHVLADELGDEGAAAERLGITRRTLERYAASMDVQRDRSIAGEIRALYANERMDIGNLAGLIQKGAELVAAKGRLSEARRNAYIEAMAQALAGIVKVAEEASRLKPLWLSMLSDFKARGNVPADLADHLERILSRPGEALFPPAGPEKYSQVSRLERVEEAA